MITICARGGSKGIPGKNIKILNGRPLIAYTIDSARNFQQFFPKTRIVLSTDSSEIKRVAEDCGLYSDYTRPAELAGDKAGKISAIQDALKFYESKEGIRYDYILDLDVTSPLRNQDDLQRAYEILLAEPGAVNLFSVSPAARSPYFNMVEKKENGFYAQVKTPVGTILSRQFAPEVYDMNASFYFYRRSFFDAGYSGAITDKSLVYVMPHICFDLDQMIDFEFISYLMEQGKLGFEL